MDPYQIFFPVGLLFSILGTLFWVPYGFGWSQNYPAAAHSDLMIGGFLLAFASGFLMTAIPRFTGTENARRSEKALVGAIFFGLFTVAHIPIRLPFHVLSLALLAVLFRFASQRFTKRSYDPPSSFVFIGFGFLCGVVGLALLLLFDFGRGTPFLLTLGKELYYNGMMLCFVIGVGSKLIPALLGRAPMPVHQIGKSSALARADRLPLVLSAIFVLSFVLEIFAGVEAGRSLRGAVVAFIALTIWKLQRLPRGQGRLAWWLWVSAWLLVIGVVAQSVSMTWAIHFEHIYLIGGFGLITLMIASRITLAHGGFALELETKSRAIRATGLLIVLALFTRVSAPFFPKIYNHHLAYAAITWTIAVVVWGWAFVPKIFQHAKDLPTAEAEHC